MYIRIHNLSEPSKIMQKFLKPRREKKWNALKEHANILSILSGLWGSLERIQESRQQFD